MQFFLPRGCWKNPVAEFYYSTSKIKSPVRDKDGKPDFHGTKPDFHGNFHVQVWLPWWKATVAGKERQHREQRGWRNGDNQKEEPQSKGNWDNYRYEEEQQDFNHPQNCFSISCSGENGWCPAMHLIFLLLCSGCLSLKQFETDESLIPLLSDKQQVRLLSFSIHSRLSLGRARLGCF